MLDRAQTGWNKESRASDKFHFDRSVLVLFLVQILGTFFLLIRLILDPLSSHWLELILFVYFTISLAKTGFHLMGYLRFVDRQQKIAFKSDPFFTIIVPAFNEEKMIQSVLLSFNRYATRLNFELVLVDDGSSDQTLMRAQEIRSHLLYPLQAVRQVNQGKAAALNYGLSLAQSDYVLCMDADSTLNLVHIHKCWPEFESDPKLAALAGMVEVLPQKNQILSPYQNLEYRMGHFQRKTLSCWGGVPIIPGPIGLFRKSSLDAVGGYEREEKTFAEDAELTLRLLAHGYNVRSTSYLSALTEGPQNLAELVRQRYRWSRGLYQAMFKNFKPLLYSGSNRNLVVLIYLIWEQILLPIFDFSLLLLIVVYFVFANTFEISMLTIGLLACLDGIVGWLACKELNKPWVWSARAVIARLTYSNLTMVWKILALFDELNNRTMSWDKLSRQGLSVLQSGEVGQ